jgi:hypothetical protein
MYAIGCIINEEVAEQVKLFRALLQYRTASRYIEE